MSAERSTIDIDGPVSVLSYGGSGPLIVCVHGLEGSAFNWDLIAPALAERHEVIAPDLSGFAYTPPADRGCTVDANADLVAGLIERTGPDAVLIGNSMGGLISLIVADRYPDLVRGLVLIDPAAPVSNWMRIRPGAAARLSTPLIPKLGGLAIERYRARQTPEQSVAETLDFVTHDSEVLPASVREHALEVARLRRSQPWSTDVLCTAVNSIAPYVVRRSSFARMLHRISQPTLLIHGTEDALIQIETARWMARERPDWTHAFLKDVGHVPMLEAPRTVLDVIDAWESSVPVA